jgi:hypothetical protein
VRDADTLTCRAAELAAFAPLHRAEKHTPELACPPTHRAAIPVDASAGAGGRDTDGAQAEGFIGQSKEDIDVATLSALAGRSLSARVAMGGWPNGARHAADGRHGYCSRLRWRSTYVWRAGPRKRCRGHIAYQRRESGRCVEHTQVGQFRGPLSLRAGQKRGKIEFRFRADRAKSAGYFKGLNALPDSRRKRRELL